MQKGSGNASLSQVLTRGNETAFRINRDNVFSIIIKAAEDRDLRAVVVVADYAHRAVFVVTVVLKFHLFVSSY